MFSHVYEMMQSRVSERVRRSRMSESMWWNALTHCRSVTDWPVCQWQWVTLWSSSSTFLKDVNHEWNNVSENPKIGLSQLSCSVCTTAATFSLSHSLTYTYVRTYIHSYIHTYIHTCIHTCIHECMHTYTHTANPHTYAHSDWFDASKSSLLRNKHVVVIIHTQTHSLSHAYLLPQAYKVM